MSKAHKTRQNESFEQAKQEVNELIDSWKEKRLEPKAAIIGGLTCFILGAFAITANQEKALGLIMEIFRQETTRDE